jgi:Calcineurin-like phosphoesterase
VEPPSTTLPRRAALVAAIAAFTAAALSTPAIAAQPAADRGGFSLAVIGDIPYEDAQIARFPAVVDQISADPAVQFVVHLGDIKSGSTVCSDEYFAQIRADFDKFADPLVYTPGDNEWTDCHRPNNGGFNPLERLAAIRQVFFDRPGKTLGRQSVAVASQADRGLPENVGFTRAGVAFAALHVVGSNNGLAPWTGQQAPTPEQAAEVQARTDAALDLINETFDHASGARAVVLMVQADMFDPTVPNPQFANYSAFQPIVRAIAARSAEFGKPVYLFDGDSHVYHEDAPLAPGSPWLDFYDVAQPAANLGRITVDGSTGVQNYLRVTVSPADPGVLTWEKVPFAP